MHYILLSLFVTAFLPLMQAFMIDTKSCDPAATAAIRQGLKDAFAMAAVARQELDAITPDAGMERLINLLFVQRTGGGRDLPWIFRYMEDIDTEKDYADIDNNSREVIFYCDLKRFEVRADGLWWNKYRLDICYDVPATSHPITLDPNNSGDCKAGLEAVTWWHDDRASEVTICPWFLKQVLKKGEKAFWDKRKEKFKDGFKTKTRSFLGIGPKVRDVDTVVQALDMTLLHELTHTGQGSLGLKDEIINGQKAYGWELARQLAKDAPDRALNNADSIALFATTLRLLQLDPPVYVSDDGEVSTDVPTRRDLADAPSILTNTAAVETFITMVREKRAAETGVLVKS